MQEKKKVTSARGLGRIYSDTEIVEYAICPARAFINTRSSNRSKRQQVRERYRSAINDVSIHLMNGNTPNDPMKLAADVVEKVFDGIEYNKKEIDMTATAGSLVNFIRMLPSEELVATSMAKKFEVDYDGIIVSSQVDLFVQDKRGIIHPTLVDFSHTRYEPFFNPIMYRCQMVVDSMANRGTNTEVMVLAISSGKKWLYAKKRYDALVRASIEEFVLAMSQDLYPARFGWWCSGCYYRGICHRIIVKNN